MAGAAAGAGGSGVAAPAGRATGAANIQGDLHVPRMLGDDPGKRKKKRKLRKDEPRSLYVRRDVLNADAIIAWAKANGFNTTVQAGDMHVTLAFSRAPVAWPEPQDGQIRFYPTNPHIARFGPQGDVMVLAFDDEELEQRWQALCDLGCSWDWPSYQPHITISFDGFNVNDLHPPEVEPYAGVIVLGPERFEEVNEGWKDTIVEKFSIFKDYREDDAMNIAKIGARNSRKDLAMIQQIHDHTCALGASCQGLQGYEADKDKTAKRFDQVRIAKIDESLGLVFGYAIVCKVDGQDYYDKNIDKAGDGSVKRVPEHIPEASMLKAAVDFMQTARVGNEMHKGGDAGTYVFAFPLTTDIAKAFGISTNTTGLMVAYKPPPEVFAKFKDGTYTGFSIEGRRVAAKMEEDA